MKLKHKNLGNLALASAFCIAMVGCQKMDRPKLSDYPKDANPPGGPLKFYVAFDGTTPDPQMRAVDSIKATFPSDNPFTSVDGISGKAAKGLATMDKAIKYVTPNDFAKSTSMSISFWLKQTPTTGGAQFVFSMPKTPRTDSWTTNTDMFMLIEDQGQSTAEKAAVKFAIKDQWKEFVVGTPGGAPQGDYRIPNLLNGQWHHLVIVYNETTSKLSYFVDGAQLTNLPAAHTDLTRQVNNAAVPYGPMNFNNITGFVIGGWSQHAGLPGPGDKPENADWAKAFSGTIDQFRLYNKALSASEVSALFNSKL